MKVKSLLFHFLRTVEWSLVASIGLATLASFYVAFHPSFWSWLLFVISFIFLYYHELGERAAYRYSYIALFLLLFSWLFRSDGTFFFALVFALCAGFGVALWLVLVRFLVHNKKRILSLLHIVLIYFAFLFATTTTIGITSAIVSSCIAGLLLSEECIRFDFPWKRRVFLISGAVSFILLESVLIIRSLPLDAVGEAGMLALIAVSIRNMVVAHFSGNLRRRYILEQTVAFVGLAILILMTGHWIV